MQDCIRTFGLVLDNTLPPSSRATHWTNCSSTLPLHMEKSKRERESFCVVQEGGRTRWRAVVAVTLTCPQFHGPLKVMNNIDGQFFVWTGRNSAMPTFWSVVSIHEDTRSGVAQDCFLST